ncbi:MAG: radical SAM protein [Candidatus Edwardsbacteria bacterium]|nr:radical SAM protein [Candidatus Edwardsbacteria bacterium]
MAWLKDLFKKERPLKAGLFQYRGQEGDKSFRLHLRIEPDGRGVLVINASRILHLNQTAAEMAKHIIEDDEAAVAVEQMLKRYRGVKPGQLEQDYNSLKEKIFALARTDDICPVTYMDINRIEPFETPVSAPYRMDLALTYKCDNACGHCYLPKDRQPAELNTDQWKQVIKKIWEIGIPHVCFTGGEATLRPDLTGLIAYAEETGLVTGLLTNGRNLKNNDLVNRMVESGLDHFQITLESHDAKVHDQMVGAKGAWKETVQGIKNAVATPVYTITNTTLTRLNADNIEATMEFIKSLGVAAMACNGLIYTGQGATCGIGFKEEELKPLMERIRQKARELELRLIWYTPTQYCQLDPVNLELGVKTCTAAKYNMCLEPDGSVIPCQSYFAALGNILADPWTQIWNAKPAVDLRKKAYLQEKCKDCDKLPLCGGGCPIYNQQQEVLCLDSKSNG